MAKHNRVREQHIAVFGESGSGKTVLVSSFFGPTQEGSYKNDLWDFVAMDTGQGNRLYRNYLGMRDNASAPPATQFTNTRYDFAVKLKNEADAKASKRPFDELRLAWHDYPGEWFESEPSSDEERRRRTETFISLLSSDVALLLVDGQKLLEYQGEEERYLKALFGSFRQNIRRLGDELPPEDKPLVEFPRIWILALSKADLFPDWTVDTFRDLLVLKSADDIQRLRETIASLISAPEALAIGEDFLLLSSAKFELAQDLEPIEIDVSKRIGLDLMLPISSILPLERRVLWQSRLSLPRNVVDKIADNADVIATVLVGASTSPAQKVLKKVLKSDKRVQAFADALPLLAKAVKIAGPTLKEMNQKARARHDHLQATLTQFKLDLEQGAERKVIRTQK